MGIANILYQNPSIYGFYPLAADVIFPYVICDDNKN